MFKDWVLHHFILAAEKYCNKNLPFMIPLVTENISVIHPSYATKIKTKEHNNRQNVNICIRNLYTNKQRQKAIEHFLNESVQKNFGPSI